MIDIEIRHKLHGILVRLVQRKDIATWDELTNFLKSEKGADRTIMEIGFAFWNIYDPDFPDNAKADYNEFVSRCFLFLQTSYEFGCIEKRSILRSIGNFIFEGLLRFPSDAGAKFPFWPFASEESYRRAVVEENRENADIQS